MSTISEFAEQCGTTNDIRESRQHEESQVKEAKPTGIASNLTADKEREKWCHRCDRRITISPGGLREYGHGRSCERHCYGGDL